MEKIGEKIKRIRKEMGLSQENIHNQQSLVSQIESGRIATPTEGVLQEIAKRLETTFLYLIEGTDWKKETTTLKNNEMAFSPVIVDIDIDDLGNISWSHKYYPLYNERGKRNEYCPESGEKLIDKCGKCDRQVENVKQKYCIGCGKALFGSFSLPFYITELLGNRGVFDDYGACNDAIGILGKNADIYRELLVIFETVSKSEDIDSILNKFHQVSRSLGLSDSIRHKILNALNENIEIPEEIFNQISFYIQVTEAVQKKLRSVILSLAPPKIETIDNIKTKPSKSNADQIIEKFEDLETAHDKKDLINKLQSKIDLDVETEGTKGIEDERKEQRKRLWEL